MAYEEKLILYGEEYKSLYNFKNMLH